MKNYTWLYLIVIFIIITLFTIFVTNGIIGKYPVPNTTTILKQPVFGINTTKCTNSILSCDSKDIGSYNKLDPILNEDGTVKETVNDQFCQNTCKEGKNTDMKCMVISNTAIKSNDATTEYNKESICVTKDTHDNVSGTCNFKNGGRLAWTGAGDQQEWSCICNWPQYAGGENCEKINPGVCGSTEAGTFEWDGTMQIPEDGICECNDGFTLMRSLEGKAQICVKKGNETYYKDLYF